MSRISQTLLRIKKALSVCGASIADVLNEYDPASTGILSSLQLQRALSSCGIHFNKQEIQDIEIEFRYENGISIPALIAAVEMASPPKDSNLHPECYNDIVTVAKRLEIHHLTWRDALRPYDRLNEGYISVQDFYRAVGSSPETQKIARAYHNPEKSLINYRDILSTISIAQKSVRPPEQPVMPRFVRSLISMIIKRGIDIAQVFKSHDKVHCGKISTSSFFMILTTLGGVQMLPQEMQEVSQYYFDGNGMVNYFRFLKDIETTSNEMNKKYQQNNSNNNYTQEARAANVDVASVMRHILKCVNERRITVSSLFPVTRTGTISRYVFLKILNQANFELSVPEIEAVANHFDQGNNEVNYSKFVSYFAPKKQEKVYTDINQVIQYIASYLSHNRMNLSNILSRADRDGSGSGPVYQVLNAFQQAGINLGPNEINEIIRVFPGQYQNSIHLQALINAITPYVQYKPHQTESLNTDKKSSTPSSASSRASSPPKDIFELIAKLSYMIKRRDIQLSEEFRVLDRLRHSTIPVGQFLEFAHQLNSGCTENEMNSLVAYYTADNGEFDYITFVRDVTTCIQNKGTYISNDENQSPVLLLVLKRVKALLIYRMIEIEDIFMPFDHTHNGTVPCNIVVSAFSNNKLILNNDETQELLNVFKDGLNRDKFNYKKLGQAVAPITIQKDQIDKTLFPGYHNDEAHRELYCARSEIREKLHVRRKNAYMVYANTPGATLRETEFFNRLADAGIVLMKQQKDALAKYYSSAGAGIDWKKFCDDVESSNIITNQE
ncbi:hypothetical protein TRFO_02097 [Tritrichomonas foetus]|uniref:EF hand family protein n=1 Tax=Tritrichomonas foetus TaxID=1144522 RepID=A0A1J4JF81_9EUKA|nr:hypothetical protein TRFO_02097 [Tritrichomonas foetus]|eukprot:OHS96951.1 hypothetical protein TRFO_02097 [Tritrichomonas foetus]